MYLLGSNFVLLVPVSCHSQLILLKRFIYLKFVFIFSRERHMHAALLTSNIGLKLFLSCRYNRHLVLVLLTASIGLNVLLSIAQSCHLLFVQSRSFFAYSSHVLLVFRTSFANLNVVLLLAQGYPLFCYDIAFSQSQNRPPASNWIHNFNGYNHLPRHPMVSSILLFLLLSFLTLMYSSFDSTFHPFNLFQLKASRGWKRKQERLLL